MEKERTGHIYTWCRIHLLQMVWNPPGLQGLLCVLGWPIRILFSLDSSDRFRDEYVIQLV